MSKCSGSTVKKLFAGVDIGEGKLALSLSVDGECLSAEEYANDKAGHRAIVKRVRSFKCEAFVCMEATGIYFFRLAAELLRAKGIRVMVVNPARIRAFACALGKRSKTDPVDAAVIAQFAEKAGFVDWEAPSKVVERFRAIARRIDVLTREKAAEKCRLHAYKASGTTGCSIRKGIERHIAYLERCIENLRKEALSMVESDERIRSWHRLLLTVPGVGEKSAIAILSELLYMPDFLTARQWAAYAGLDPVISESGTSVKKRPKISRRGNRRLRRALFFPAMVAAQKNASLRAFCEKLCTRSKNPLRRIQALTAVMRKLLHAIWGMVHTNTPFDAAKLLPAISQSA